MGVVDENGVKEGFPAVKGFNQLGKQIENCCFRYKSAYKNTSYICAPEGDGRSYVSGVFVFDAAAAKQAKQAFLLAHRRTRSRKAVVKTT